MNTRNLRSCGTRQVTISFGNVHIIRGSVRSTMVTGPRDGFSQSSAAVRRAVSVGKSGRSEVGVFIGLSRWLPFLLPRKTERGSGQMPSRLAQRVTQDPSPNL